MPLDDPRLSTMTDSFREAKLEQLDELPEDGDYQAIIDHFDDFTGKKDGHLYVKTVMRIQHDPQYEGWKAWTIHNVTDPDRIDWFKRHVAAIGGDVESLEADFSRLDQILRTTLDTPVEITVKTSDTLDKNGQPYRNCYVNRTLGSPLTGDLPQEELELHAHTGQNDDDDIPF